MQHEIFKNVPRGTIAKLETYAQLLRKWQKAINLVSETTLDEMVVRHFVDSAQLMNFIPEKNISLADMGSGAGFPGLVLAILGVKDVHLIESDMRKATFLRTVARETETKVTVHDQRVEDVTVKVDLVTARALAPLKDLLRLGLPFSSRFIFLKGEKTEEELAAAQKKFAFESKVHPSLTDPTGRIVELFHVEQK